MRTIATLVALALTSVRKETQEEQCPRHRDAQHSQVRDVRHHGQPEVERDHSSNDLCRTDNGLVEAMTAVVVVVTIMVRRAFRMMLLFHLR